MPAYDEGDVPLPVVSFRSVVALVDRFPVLAGVDLSIDSGEVVLLTGGNGSGKTSLLRCMAGLVKVASGSAEVLGVDLSEDSRAVRRHVGLLGHQTFLYGDLSVAENVEFAAKASGADLSGVQPALESVSLDGRLASVAVDRLSAGQRRRTALAILVARNPQLWLLDEPHTGLDAAGRALLDEMIAGARSSGRTVVLSSHEVERVRHLADRTIEMAGGTVGETTGSVASDVS